MSISGLPRNTAFQARSLFRSLLRQSSQFSNYNFREYALRRTRDAFREHQRENEERKVQELIQEGLQSLRMMKRQTVISQFYQLDKLVVEGQNTGKETGQHGGIVRQKDTGSSRSGRQFGDGVNRTRTGQIDHDVFEGLPVRRWSRQVQTVSQEPKFDGTESEVSGQGGKQPMPDHPMPRDSHLLTPMSRALLRAARAGCIYIRPASKDFEDEEKEATDPEEQQAAQNTERKFAMRKWTTVPKHMETPEVEFLAKRRPGLPSLYGGTAGTVESANGAVPMRKTRFKKADPVTGNISIYAAWVPEGHKIEGEVTDDAQLIAENSQVTVTPQAPAPGTVIEGVGIVNAQGVVVAEAGSAAVLTPPKRRPPPPKRKWKGLKGRRKKVMFAPGDGADASLVHGPGANNGVSAANYSKETDSSRMSVDQTTQDDDDDDGEEGEESDEGDGDESGFDAKTPETPGPQPSAELELEPTPAPKAEHVPTPVGAMPEMTDAMPTDNTQRTSPKVAQPMAPQASPPDSAITAPNAEEPANEHPSGEMDITMAESSAQTPEPEQTEPTHMGTSTETPQDPQVQASEIEAKPEHLDQQPSGNEFDLLDNLEASLNNKPNEAPNDEQNEINAEQEPEDAITEEAAPKPEPGATVHQRLPTDAPAAPTSATEVKEPALPAQELEHAPEQELEQATDAQVEGTPVEQQSPPPTEQRRAKQATEFPTHFEEPPSDISITETPQPSIEQPQEEPEKASQGSVAGLELGRSPFEGSTPFQPVSEPPAPQDTPVHFSSKPAAADPQLETTARKCQATETEPEASAEQPIPEQPPFSFTFVEPAAEHQFKEERPES
ncbi:hypothetical protein BJX99DRAFT_249502 [Aspergillus californicus]